MSDGNREFGWVMLELMGHRQRIGEAREEEIAGGLMLRIDIPVGLPENHEFVSEFYGASSIYALRPISKEIAMQHWARDDPRPPRPADFRQASVLEDHSDDDEPY